MKINQVDDLDTQLVSFTMLSILMSMCFSTTTLFFLLFGIIIVKNPATPTYMKCIPIFSEHAKLRDGLCEIPKTIQEQWKLLNSLPTPPPVSSNTPPLSLNADILQPS